MARVERPGKKKAMRRGAARQPRSLGSVSKPDRDRSVPSSAPEAAGATATPTRDGDVGPRPEDILNFTDTLNPAQSKDRETVDRAGERHLVTFLLADEEFGVPIMRVREILRVTEISRVPQAPPHIRGVTNVRGQILPVVEIRTMLGFDRATITPESRILLIEAHQRVIGLLVDGVAQVMKVSEASVSPPEEDLVTAATEYLEGIVQMTDRLIILLDLDRTLQLRAA